MIFKYEKGISKQEQDIVIFIDNCMAHSSILKMKNVEEIFFLVNMTSMIQSMDQGIIITLNISKSIFLVENIRIRDFDIKNLTFFMLHKCVGRHGEKVNWENDYKMLS